MHLHLKFISEYKGLPLEKKVDFISTIALTAMFISIADFFMVFGMALKNGFIYIFGFIILGYGIYNIIRMWLKNDGRTVEERIKAM